MALRSPLTGNENTSLILKISADAIIEQYNQLNIDVDRFFDNISEINIFRCNDTGYRFYYPYTIFGDDKFYQELQTKIPGYYIEGRWEHNKSLSLINADDFVLEVGCGSGYFLDLLKSKKIRSVGLELNSKAAEEARKKGLTVYTQLLEEHAPENESKYDVVCSFQVLEHITNPQSYLLNATKALKEGGKLIIAVPNNNPYIFKHDIFHTLNLPPHHAGLWNKETFQNIPSFFSLKLLATYIEPLSEYKEWFSVQTKHLKVQKKIFGYLLSFIPRPVYKIALSMFRNSIEGRNIIAVFTKTGLQ